MGHLMHSVGKSLSVVPMEVTDHLEPVPVREGCLNQRDNFSRRERESG